MYIRSFTMLQTTTITTLWRICIKTLVCHVPFIFHNKHRTFTSTFCFYIFALIYLFYVPIRQNEFILGSLYSAKHSFNTWEEVSRHRHMWIVYFFDKSQGLIVPYGCFWSMRRMLPNQRSTWAQLIYNHRCLLFYSGLSSFGLPRLCLSSLSSFHGFINSCLRFLSRLLLFLKRADTIRISIFSARFWPEQLLRFFLRLCLQICLLFRSFFEFLNCFGYCMRWDEF